MTLGCPEWHERLLTSVDVGGALQRSDAVAQHLQSCAACRAAVADVESFEQALSRAKHVPELDEAMRERLHAVFARVRDPAAAVHEPLRYLPLVWGGGLAAIIVFALALWTFDDTWTRRLPVTIEAGYGVPHRGVVTAVTVGDPFHLVVRADVSAAAYVVAIDQDGNSLLFPSRVDGHWDYLGYESAQLAAGSDRRLPHPDYGDLVSSGPPGVSEEFVVFAGEALSRQELLDLAVELRPLQSRQAVADLLLRRFGNVQEIIVPIE
ncbi:MAG: hypothetical protein AAF581_15555 [Planctomycetota bacterium]